MRVSQKVSVDSFGGGADVALLSFSFPLVFVSDTSAIVGSRLRRNPSSPAILPRCQ